MTSRGRDNSKLKMSTGGTTSSLDDLIRWRRFDDTSSSRDLSSPLTKPLRKLSIDDKFDKHITPLAPRKPIRRSTGDLVDEALEIITKHYSKSVDCSSV